MFVGSMHDHGFTLSLHVALPISALLNACEITGKKLSQIKLVVNGAGAAAISCTKLYVALGLNKENLVMRSEEHTSELQSRRDLVCRLLLEKKKKNTN